jgi:DNA adenine methylase
MSTIKPVLKWVGGKRLIIHELLSKFPADMYTYHELFIGGGSVLIAVLEQRNKQNIRVKHVHAYDSNETLIHVYKNIQHDVSSVYEKTFALHQHFLTLAPKGTVKRTPSNIDEANVCRENYYYWTRKRYNEMNQAEKNSVEGTSLFIFLNKTCFRGMYREGPNGFNVPYGNYKTIDIVKKDNIFNLSVLIKDVVFQCMDFRKSFQNIKQNDFVYLDPPYVPVKSDSFVAYTGTGFNKEDHESLFQNIKNLREIKFVMSNSDGELVLQHFPQSTYNVNTISCRRAINSKKPETVANEVLICNF